MRRATFDPLDQDQHTGHSQQIGPIMNAPRHYSNHEDTDETVHSLVGQHDDLRFSCFFVGYRPFGSRPIAILIAKRSSRCIDLSAPPGSQSAPSVS